MHRSNSWRKFACGKTLLQQQQTINHSSRLLSLYSWYRDERIYFAFQIAQICVVRYEKTRNVGQLNQSFINKCVQCIETSVLCSLWHHSHAGLRVDYTFSAYYVISSRNWELTFCWWTSRFLAVQFFKFSLLLLDLLLSDSIPWREKSRTHSAVAHTNTSEGHARMEGRTSTATIDDVRSKLLERETVPHEATLLAAL